MSNAALDYEDETDESEARTAPPKKFVVGVYLVDRAYGGPEEGGWYYDCGELVRAVRIFGNEDRARTFARRMNDRLAATLNAGRRPISSVASEGQFSACVFDDNAPKHFPQTRPFYC